jgi:putative DNA primase/helicase
VDIGERIEAAEEFIRNTAAIIQGGGDRAFYRPSTGTMQLPLPEQFRDRESEFSVTAHELWALDGT